MKFFYYARKLLVGMFLRCPNCERGRMFTGLFTMREICPVCGVRFERLQGESIGGTLINLCLAEVLSIGGYFVSDFLLHPPLAFQLIVWIAFNLLFVVFFYRHARGVWVAIVYLSGGVYPDTDSTGDPKQAK
jgi:uncharacterized protein (DUF983 family)